MASKDAQARGDDCLENPQSSRELRIAIGRVCGLDIRERVDSIGHSPAAVSFRRDTLIRIALRLPNRTGDARDVRDLHVDELRKWIAKNVGLEAPGEGSHFNWNHLKSIWEEIGGGEP